MAKAAFIMKNRATYERPEADTWEYLLYSAQWELLDDVSMTPEEARQMMQRDGLQSVSPMQVYKATNGVMDNAK